MLHFISKYRILISQIFLGLYVLGTLQTQVLELFHLASHTILNHEHGGVHSYADHTHINGHQALQLLDAGDNEKDGHGHEVLAPVDKVEIFNEVSALTKQCDVTFFRNHEFYQIYSSLKLDIPSPPPEYII